MAGQKVIGAPAQDDAGFRFRQFPDNLRLKAEEVPSGGEVIAVRRQELAGVDLLRSREHLSQADELVRRTEKPFVNTADLRGLAQKISVVVGNAHGLGELPGDVMAAAAGLTGHRNYKLFHSFASLRTQIRFADPVVRGQSGGGQYAGQ